MPGTNVDVGKALVSGRLDHRRLDHRRLDHRQGLLPRVRQQPLWPVPGRLDHFGLDDLGLQEFGGFGVYRVCLSGPWALGASLAHPDGDGDDH